MIDGLQVFYFSRPQEGLTFLLPVSNDVLFIYTCLCRSKATITHHAKYGKRGDKGIHSSGPLVYRRAAIKSSHYKHQVDASLSAEGIRRSKSVVSDARR
jgi:hypothetical protein